MIDSIVISNFKKFNRFESALSKRIVMVGPNDSGKTSLLQAICTWSEFASIWLKQYGDNPIRDESGEYLAVDLSLEGFESLKVSAFEQLWWNLMTDRPISIKVNSKDWDVEFQAVYKSPTLISIHPARSVSEVNLIELDNHKFSVIYAQSLSGLDAKETQVADSALFARVASGQGGSVIRSILLKVYEQKENWDQLQTDIESFFGYELSPPSGSDPIYARYRPDSSQQWFELTSGASGFLQILLILASLHLKETASLLLVDEPDVHLHTFLKEKIYRHIREFCELRNRQLIVATHSNFLVEAARREGRNTLQLVTPKSLNLLSHSDAHELLKTPTEAIVNIEIRKRILFLEGRSDFDILLEWAKVLNHPALKSIEQACREFTAESKGDMNAVKKRYSAYKALVPELKGIDIRDRNNKGLDTNWLTEDGHLTFINEDSSLPEFKQVLWKRYEIENYLINPNVLERFARITAGSEGEKLAREYMKQELPPKLYQDPFSATIADSKKGKDTVDAIMNVAGVDIKTSEFYKIAAAMKREEIHQEVLEMLDLVSEHFC